MFIAEWQQCEQGLGTHLAWKDDPLPVKRKTRHFRCMPIPSSRPLVQSTHHVRLVCFECSMDQLLRHVDVAHEQLHEALS